MKLFTQKQHQRLLANGRATKEAQEAGRPEPDHAPVVKLFTPDAGATWLLTEIDPDEPELAFGLCDLGLGFPELGNVSLTELAELRGNAGLPVERDRWFTANGPLSAYAKAANAARRIVA